LLNGPGRPHAWPRLLAAVAAPVALASTALVPSAATTAQPAARSAAVQTASTASAPAATTGQGQQLLSLPGLDGSSYTVTLITGDQVRLTQTGSGQYTATGIPGSGPATQINFQAQGNGQTLTSLQAIPDDAAGLISSGQVDPGLFDLQWLVKHGDTGTAPSIPVTLQYPPTHAGATLRSAAARLTGATVTGTTPASGEVTMTVAASKAASFWTALTGQTATTATSPSSMSPAALAGGASRIWLTGHQVSAAAGPQAQAEQPQDTQPLYTVTETITRSTGPVDRKCGRTILVSNFCLTIPAPSLWGVAGSGQGNDYDANGRGTCVSETQATPYPVCTALQLTYSVPAGVYYAHAEGEFLTTDEPEGTLETADVTLDVPQFTVAGNTAISLDADQAVPVTVSTPQPGVPYGPGEVQASRRLPDGTYDTDILEELNSQGSSNWWAVPTPPGDQATIGDYHYSPGLSLGAPEVTAAVTAPSHLTLHPLYPCDSDTLPSPGCNVTRFSGRQTLPLVNAGYGTASDFSTIDASGKLALITETYTCAGFQYCSEPGYVLWEQLADAQQAGAAGVLINPGVDAQGYPIVVPVTVDTAGDANPTANVPFAEIDNAEGSTLLGLLAKGPVTVSVSDNGETPYAYFLRFDQEGRIPASLHYTLTSHQLAEVSSSYNAASPPQGGIQVWGTSFRADDDGGWGTSVALDFPGPRTMRDYYGPLSPSLVWKLQADIPFQSGGPTVDTVFGQPSASTLAWEEPPATLGAPDPDNEAHVYQALQDEQYSEYCAGCRQGNTLWPIFALVNGANPAGSDGVGGFTPGSIQLYNQAGQEIQSTTDPFSGVATYQLPAQQAQYKLVAPYDNTTTTWDFTSAEPTTDQTPQGTFCAGTVFGESAAPCQADPLVFLRYDAGLSLTNTISPGTRQLQVTGYHQDPNAPPVTSLQLWTSTDGGTTWTPARVTGGRNGTFTVTYTVPASGTNGYVSIKAQASDAAGNTITQEIDNAYAVATAPAAGGQTGPNR
jgi:hypothetical protein